MPNLAQSLVVALAAGLPAQIATGHYLALTTRAPAGSALLDIDPNGTVRTLRRFAADGATPLACTWDPLARHAIVAVATPSGSQLHRVDPASSFERQIGNVAGTVVALEVNEYGDLWVLTGGASGALWEVARNGSAPSLRLALPHASALGARKRDAFAWIATSPPGGTPSLSAIDARTGIVVIAPMTVPGLAGRRITGVFDLPTGAPREVVTDDQGGVHLFEFWSTLRTLAVNPPLPAGATTSLMLDASFSLDAIVLGDARAPQLTRVPVFGAPSTATRIAGPLPGSPVDFDLVDSRASQEFGRDCGGDFGTKSFALPAGGIGRLEVQGAPANSLALAVLGLSEQTFAGGSLPVALPGGCPLLVAPDVLVPGFADATGLARLTFPVPAPLPRGFAAYAQWVLAVGPNLGTTNASSVQTEP